jgi:hypothetical protein
VQTEDSGLGNPHVITHLFHGGNIMASEKRDYSDLIEQNGRDGLEGAVRKLMEGQHKSMLKQLSRGEHDAAIEQRMGPDVFRVESAAEVASAPVTEEERPPPPPTQTGTSPVGSKPAAMSPSAAAPTAEPTRIGVEPSVAEVTQPVSRLARVFGERVASEKPLDEMVLDYLVENARNKRKRTNK